MLHIKFEYRDEFTRDDRWSEQECIASSVREAVKFYGLDQPDVEYRIVLVEEVSK